MFDNYKLKTSSRKHLEDNSQTHIVSLMYKLITRAPDTDDLSIGFEPDRGRKQRALNINKNQNGKFQLGIIFKDVFGFAEHQEKATYGLI